MAKQLQFSGFKKPNVEFGGSLLKGNPKGKRPLSSKLPILITLRANRSEMRKPKMFGVVSSLVERTSKKYGVRVYRYANVGNHLHILVRLTKRTLWASFIRELTGRIAQELALTWLYRPHTRIIGGWKKAFNIAKDYVYLNNLEAEGWINRRETRSLKDLKAIFSD